MKLTATLAEIERTDYGRGAERIIRGARFAVVAQGTGGRIEHVLSTHRTEDAAIKVLRKASKHSGRLHYAEIIA